MIEAKMLGWLEVLTSFSKMALTLTLPTALSMSLWLAALAKDSLTQPPN